jgi:hypothetical protein
MAVQSSMISSSCSCQHLHRKHPTKVNHQSERHTVPVFNYTNLTQLEPPAGVAWLACTHSDIGASSRPCLEFETPSLANL